VAAPETKIKVTADTSQAERKIKDLEKALEDIQGVASAAGKALGVITAAGAAIGVAVGLTIQKFSDLADAADAIGISAQNLTYLQQSAQLAGVGADELNGALRRLQANLGDALIKGTGPATEALKRLQVPLDDIINLPADEQLKKISAALKDISNPAERSALAMDLLGKQGPRLLEAADAMDQMKKRAQELGLALSDVDVQAIRDADDALTELKFLFDGALKKAAAAIAPYIIAIAEAIGDAVVEAGGFDAILSSIVDTIKLVTKAAAIMLTFFAAAKLTAGIIAAVAAFTRMYSAIKLATTAAGILNAVLGKNPIIKIVGALAAIGGSVAVLKEVDDMFADLDKRANAVMGEINVKVAKQKAETQAVVKAAKEYNEVQKKAIEALGDVISKLKSQVDQQKNILKFGEEEANVQKTIAEEREKLKKVGLDLTTEQALQLRQLIEEESLVKRINEQRKKAIEYIKGMMDPDTVKRIELQRELTIAQEDYNKALAGGDRAVTEAAKTNVQALELNLNNTIIKTARSKVDLYKIEDDYYKSLENLMANQQNLLAIGFSQESKLFQDLESQKYKMAEDYAVRRSDLVSRQAQNIISLEIAKFSPMMAAEQKFVQEMAKIRELERMAKTGEITMDQEQHRMLIDAKLMLEKEYQNNRAKIAEESAAKLEQIELDRITRTLMAEKGAIAQKLSAGDQETLQKIGQQERQKAIVAERINFEKKSEFEKVQFGIDAAAQMFSSLGAQNKKAFEAAKAFNIANALMNTYMAATKALATYPFPFGLIAAAAAVAAGMAQVGAIRSQQYSGRSLGGPVMASQSYVVGENGPEMFTPATTGRITRNSDMPSGGGVTNINFTIVANDTSGFDQLLTSRKGVIQQIISDAMLERGQRSMM
jgi:hypothetical protein